MKQGIKFKSLLCVGNDAKTIKGEKYGYLTGILYLAPGRIAGHGNVCPHAAECLAACLYTAGRGTFNSVQTARINRTKAFFTHNAEFMAQLKSEIGALVRKAARKAARWHKRIKPAVRLNGTSDIAWEKLGILEAFPSVQFYDYTKNPLRMLQFLAGKMPANYHLTFSRQPSNEAQALDLLARGGNVTVVFRKTLPATWNGYRVVNGDLSDLRFADGVGVVVGLTAKGKAKHDTSGFVIDHAEHMAIAA